MVRSRLVSNLFIALWMLSWVSTAHAEGLREGASSLLLPTTGQAMNGQLGNTKTKVMAGVEVASITTITILGLATGGAAVLIGAIPLAANHVWSSMDAYGNARNKNQYALTASSGQELLDAQRTLEYSRQNRFEREQAGRYDIRERVRLAGEQANA